MVNVIMDEMHQKDKTSDVSFEWKYKFPLIVNA